MATVASYQGRSAYEGLKPYRWSIREFQKISAAGIFPAGVRGELRDRFARHPEHRAEHVLRSRTFRSIG